MHLDYRRPGFRAALVPGLRVRGTKPYFQFLKQAFGAELRDANLLSDGNLGHAEVVIGSSILELSEAQPKWPAQPCAHHVYVPDTDDCYARAVGAGATSLSAPEDTTYGDRSANIRDQAGNLWFISTRLSGGPVPQGFRTITPYVLATGADAVISFMVASFGARERLRVPCDDGTVMHAEVQIDDSIVEIADGGPPWNPMPCSLHLYVPDVDASYKRALTAGATTVYEPTDQFYGDRECGIVDPGGNHWFIATFRENVSKDEMERRMAAAKT
jgi:uncharacterized glyoxalase superfamily protein PhnB